MAFVDLGQGADVVCTQPGEVGEETDRDPLFLCPREKQVACDKVSAPQSGQRPTFPHQPGSNALVSRLTSVQAFLADQVHVAERLAGKLAELQAEHDGMAAEIANLSTQTLAGKPIGVFSFDDKTAVHDFTSVSSLPTPSPSSPFRKSRTDPVCASPVHGAGDSNGIVGGVSKRSLKRFSQHLKEVAFAPQVSIEDRRNSTGRLFTDPQELKDKIQEDLLEEPFDVTTLYYDTGLCQALAKSKSFEFTSLLMVIMSSVWIAVEIDLDDSLMLSEAHPVFQIVAHFLCAFFSMELLVRLLAFKNKCHAFRDSSFSFDLMLVLLIVFETWVMSIAMALTTFRLDTSNLRVLVVFRCMRLLRVLRLARVLRNLPELLVIVRGIVLALKAIAVIIVLLGLVIYVSAIVFTVLLEGTELGTQRFSSVPASMGTLLIECTLSGSKGGIVMSEAQGEHFMYSVLVLMFVLLANVTMMGVLGGVLVQTVRATAELEREESAAKQIGDKMDALWKIINQHDDDGDGRISEDELQDIISDKALVKVLQGIGVDLEGLIDVSGFIFQQNDGQLSQKQFKRMVLDLRGKQVAKVKDHVETRKFMEAMLIKLLAGKPTARMTLEHRTTEKLLGRKQTGPVLDGKLDADMEIS